jgi:hypothetical protein
MNERQQMPATAIERRGQRLKMIATEAAKPIQTMALSIRSPLLIQSSVGANQ